MAGAQEVMEEEDSRQVGDSVNQEEELQRH